MYEIVESFDKEWKEAKAMDPEIAVLEKKRSDLRDVVYEWESKQYRSGMTTKGVTIRPELDKMQRPPDIAKAEKEVKALEEKISEVRIKGDRRAAVLEKYHRLLADELLNKINEYIKGLGADEPGEENPFGIDSSISSMQDSLLRKDRLSPPSAYLRAKAPCGGGRGKQKSRLERGAVLLCLARVAGFEPATN